MIAAEKRWGMGVAASVGVHLLAVVIIGFFGYRFVTRPPEILEVSLVGGGGAPVAEAQQQEQPEETVVKSPDDIIDEKLKPEIKPEKVKKQQEQTAATTNQAAGEKASNAEGNAAGPGTGAGAGEEAGDGSGHGVPTTPPRILSSVQPRYPASARNQGIEGVTAVKMLISEEGRVEEAFVVRSSGNEALDQSALAAVYQWRFSPARDKFGQKARCYVTQGIRFDIRR